MEQKEPEKPSSEERLQIALSRLSEQLNFLMQAKSILTREDVVEKRPQFWAVISYLTYAVVKTSESFLLLAQKGHVRDCFILSRTIYETISNICFICIKGDEVANLAWRHTKQKIYRSTKQELDINGRICTTQWQGHIDIENDPELKQALTDFTDNRGREFTRWTPENPTQQLKAIDAHCREDASTFLQIAFHYIYNQGSEINHGTLYGILLTLGLADPFVLTYPSIEIDPFIEEGIEEEQITHQRDMLTVLSVVLVGTIFALIEILSEISSPTLLLIAAQSAIAFYSQSI